MTKKLAIERKTILINDILTRQPIVRKKRIEDFKKFFLQKDPDKDFSPVEVMEFKDNGSKYLLRDGNHRLRARWELGIQHVIAIVLDNSIDPSVKQESGLHIKELKIVDEIEEEDIKKETWKLSKHYF